MSPLPYYLCLMMPLAFFIGLYSGGVWTALAPILGFVLIPLADFFVGRDRDNLSPEQEDQVRNKFSYRLITLLWVPIQLAVVLVGAFVVSTASYSGLEMFGLIVSAGVVTGGIGITIAHELCHRQTKLEQWASQLVLLGANYMHFHIEHVVGHHQKVSTPEDPASARFGQSLYSFLPQTIIGSWQSVWAFEKKRVRVKKLPVWKNRLYWYLFIQTAFSLSLGLLFTWQAFWFHLAQSFVGLVFLEIVNYIEHYGLERKKLPNGRYEKVTPKHSWNANHTVSNLLLFKLQRHSDHHANPLRRYQILRDYPEAPQLPFGYPTMVLMALVPPIWRFVMDERVLSYNMAEEEASTA
ncbi:MAG: alkane 1-monooxygenase [Pseudobacteriovorax sp.]|nr:alkane 1-monooxygenase [Pseudobacteriovorax sp.]